MRVPKDPRHRALGLAIECIAYRTPCAYCKSPPGVPCVTLTRIPTPTSAHQSRRAGIFERSQWLAQRLGEVGVDPEAYRRLMVGPAPSPHRIALLERGVRDLLAAGRWRTLRRPPDAERLCSEEGCRAERYDPDREGVSTCYYHTNDN